MKEFGGVWLPDGEQHMVEWMEKRNHRVDGRLTYQHHKLEAAVEHCRKFRNAVDVGAHVGLWAMHLVKLFDRVHAFEPVKAHRECLVRNVRPLTSMAVYAVALGAKADKVSIWSNPSSSGDSWVEGPGDITMMTLDSLELEDVDLLKVDCEGYELQVLRGAAQTLRRCRPTVVVEQKPKMAEKFGLRHKEAVRYLEADFGYTVRRELSGDFILT